jgi:Cu(I)-responsive transcriptional regulator
MTPLTASAIHSARRHAGEFKALSAPADVEQWSSWQQPAKRASIVANCDPATYMDPVATTGSRGSVAMTQTYSIGALADATATKVETIRYYERIGLLPEPGRTAGNYRLYRPEHVTRLGVIRRARALGFSIDQVRELLGLSDHEERPCAEVDAIARQHLAEVDAKLAALKKLRRELDSLIRQCHSGTIADCRIIDALGAHAAVG